MKAIDYSEILKGYEKKWVALSNDEKTVIASGNTLKQAKKHALEKGENHPVLVKVPDSSVSYLL